MNDLAWVTMRRLAEMTQRSPAALAVKLKEYYRQHRAEAPGLETERGKKGRLIRVRPSPAFFQWIHTEH